MSTKTRPPKRFRPDLESVEARLCLSATAQHLARPIPPRAAAPAIAPKPQHPLVKVAGQVPHRVVTPQVAHRVVAPKVAPARVQTPPTMTPKGVVRRAVARNLARARPLRNVARPGTAPRGVILAAPQPRPVPIAPAPVVTLGAPQPAGNVAPAPVPVSAPAPVVVMPASGATSQALSSSVLSYVQSKMGTKVGDGQCGTVVLTALRVAGASTNFDFSNPNGDYLWGQLAATLTPQSRDLSQVRAGDIIQFRDAKFVSANGSWSLAAHHTAVVAVVSGDTLTVLEQNVNGVMVVQPGTYRLNDMTQGTMWAYRPIGA